MLDPADQEAQHLEIRSLSASHLPTLYCKMDFVREVNPSSAARQQENPSSLPPDPRRELVERVVNSQEFSRSAALRSFLLHITDHVILGRTEKLKEQTIGAEVLGRKSNYDPVDDNIVRVRAHELRGRVQKYFATEGAEEPIIITIPKGSYVPEFVPRRVVAAEMPPAPQDAERSTVAVPKTQTVIRYWLPLAGLFLVTILVSIALTRFAMKNDKRASVVPPSGAIRDFWGQFFDKPDEELRIVYADTNFGLWQDMSGKTLNLGDYLSHKYLEIQSDKLREVATRRATSPADLSVSVHLASLTGQFGGRTSVQSARNANAEYFRHGNTVLLGSHRSNPWVEVYEPNLNFELKQNPDSGAPLYINRAPQPNEAAVYAIPEMLDTKGDEQREFTSYGLIALLKVCGEQGLIVVDEGLNMQATQAAGDQITDPQRLDVLLRNIGHRPGTDVAPFEALIQITSLPGGYDNPKVIAFRLRPAESCVGR